MKILKNQGSYEILTPNIVLEQSLELIELAGRTCYRSQEKQIDRSTSAPFVRKRLRDHHESIIEHVSITVRFLNVSRGFTHQLVRHRLASFSQESTRYVDYTKKGVYDLGKIHLQIIVPPHRDEEEKFTLKDGRLMSFTDMATDIEMFYQALRQGGWVPEDARQILPIGIKSEIVVTTNLREWRHIFSERTSRSAHWEIRGLMCQLLQDFQKRIPVIFYDLVFEEKDKNGIPYYKKQITKK